MSIFGLHYNEETFRIAGAVQRSARGSGEHPVMPPFHRQVLETQTNFPTGSITGSSCNPIQ
jgi:hypothetical protein